MLANKKTILYLLVLIVVNVLLSGCGQNTVPEVWGRAEGKEVDITSKIPGRVVSMLVNEGDKVEKGQVLARIDSRDIQSQIQQAQANIAALQAQAAQAITVTNLQAQTTRAALATAQAQLGKVRTDLELAKSDYNRFSDLAASEAISRQLFETYGAKYQVAQAAYLQAEANVAAAQAGLLQNDVNVANEDTLRSRVAQAQATLEQIEIALDETQVRAPFSGIVSAKYVEEGAMVSQGMPLVSVQDPLDNWVNIKVKETELSRYALQQTLQLQGRDNSLRLTGTIVDISSKPEFATYRATNERGDTDIITFNVKICINSDIVRPGMRFKISDGGK